jgi:AraC-like DNA-binding protein
MQLKLMEELPSGRVTENRMAALLNISKRTLHRKLRSNGQTFRSLLLQVRRGMARRYLFEQNFSVTETAFLLGYNDTSAFSRAFKGWFGHSPSQIPNRAAQDAGRSAREEK